MDRKTETVVCILFVLMFAILMGFCIATQPRLVSKIAIHEPAEVGKELDPAISRLMATSVKMTLVHVDYQQNTAELMFSIRNNTDKPITLVSDYISCFSDKVLAHGRTSGANRYVTVEAHGTATWSVFVDGVTDDMDVYYMDIPNELVFGPWKAIRGVEA